MNKLSEEEILKMFERKKTLAIKNAVEQGLPVLPEDLDLKDLLDAKVQLEKEGTLIEPFEIDIGFILEYYCMCRVQNMPSLRHDLKFMLLQEKHMASTRRAVVYFFDENSNRIKQLILRYDEVDSLVRENSLRCQELPWEFFDDESAWTLGSLTIDTLFNRKKQQEKTMVSDVFPLSPR